MNEQSLATSHESRVKIQKFQDILAWQKARVLTSEIYSIFRESRDYGFRDQIQRASVSIMNNIAEGFERRGDQEFSRFLHIAKGSCSEVRSMLYVALDQTYLNEERFQKLDRLCDEIARMIGGLLKTLKTRD